MKDTRDPVVQLHRHNADLQEKIGDLELEISTLKDKLSRRNTLVTDLRGQIKKWKECWNSTVKEIDRLKSIIQDMNVNKS